MEEQKAPNHLGDQKIADLLMLKETPLLAGVVTLVTQPFAQIREHYVALPDWLPLLIAAVISTLLAVYYVWTIRRTPREESLILIPLVVLILFSGSLGANNLVNAAARGNANTAAANDGASEQLRARLQTLEAQLELEVAEGRLLRKALGLKEEQPDKVSESNTNPIGALSQGLADAVFGFFVNNAMAQSATEQPKPSRPTATKANDQDNRELMRQLKEIEGKKRELLMQRKALAMEDRPDKENFRSAPLWKSW